MFNVNCMFSDLTSHIPGHNNLPRGCLCRNARTQLFCSFWSAGISCRGNTCDITPADTHFGTAHTTRHNTSVQCIQYLRSSSLRYLFAYLNELPQLQKVTKYQLNDTLIATKKKKKRKKKRERKEIKKK